MYRFYEEKDKIREIQRYLFITESGNYDDKTREAVKGVQSRSNIPETGEIDYESFNAIYREYKVKLLRDELQGCYPAVTFPLTLGTYSKAVRDANEMLIELSKHYGIQTNLRYGDHFGDRSEKILEEISVIYDVERKAGEIDEEMFRLMEKDFTLIRMRVD